MRGTSLKITGLGVLAALAAAPSASAALTDDPHFFDAKRGPDLRSITILQDPDAGNRTELARFCFDERLQRTDYDPTDDETGFFLAGYDSADRVWAIDADRDEVPRNSADQNCVIVQFEDGIDMSRFTVGGVTRDQVFADRSNGRGNLADAVGVTGTLETGLTALPNLLEVVTDTSRNELIFVFDEPLDDINEWDFGFYNDEGRRYDSDNVVGAEFNADKYEVRVAFEEDPSNPNAIGVSEAERAFVLSGTVEDQGEDNENLFESAPVVYIDDDNFAATDNQVSSRPDLVSARFVGRNTVQFNFDNDCDLANEDLKPWRFKIRDIAGHQLSGDMAFALDDPLTPGATTIVEVTFGDDGSLSGSIADYDVQAAVRQGAVRCDGHDDDNAGNTIGSVPLQGVSGPLSAFFGYTSAPDLHTAELDRGTNVVTLTFDQDVASFDEELVRVLGENGNELIPDEPVELLAVDGNKVYLRLANGQAIATGIQLRPGAAVGERGDESIIQIVGLDPARRSGGNQGAGGVGGDGGNGGPKPPSNGGGGGGGQGTSAPAPAQQVAGAGGQAPVARVSPARSGRSAKARVLYAKYRKGKLTLKVSGKAKKVKIRIALRNRKGKTVKTVTRTIKTNRRVTLKNLTRSSSVKSVRIRVL